VSSTYSIVRDLPSGHHPLLTVLPDLATCPLLPHIVGRRRDLLAQVVVHITPSPCICHVDTTEPSIVIDPSYYHTATPADLYLDVLHELTHLRQHLDGQDIWDDHLPYEQRPTEIEAFAIAVLEAQRRGLSEAAILAYLRQPWLTEVAVQQLRANIATFLAPRTLLRQGQCYRRRG